MRQVIFPAERVISIPPITSLPSKETETPSIFMTGSMASPLILTKEHGGENVIEDQY